MYIRNTRISDTRYQFFVWPIYAIRPHLVTLCHGHDINFHEKAKLAHSLGFFWGKGGLNGLNKGSFKLLEFGIRVLVIGEFIFEELS